jgi:hypothetical protein
MVVSRPSLDLGADAAEELERSRLLVQEVLLPPERLYEGHLSLCPVMFWMYRDSTYKREWVGLNGRMALV